MHAKTHARPAILAKTHGCPRLPQVGRSVMWTMILLFDRCTKIVPQFIGGRLVPRTTT